MEGILTRQSPLFGRMTAQWHLEPLPFGALAVFFPDWSMEDRVAAWSIAGGIPAYLEWLDPALSLRENLKEVILAPGSMFLAEPMFLLYDEVRDPKNYLAILNAIGAGIHDFDAIAQASMIDKKHLSAYLARLQELRLIERRLPATLTPAQMRRSRRGRYRLKDAYFSFYFRFIAPRRLVSPRDRTALAQSVAQDLDAFVGATGFETLAHAWLDSEKAQTLFPFRPEQVGWHWDKNAQVDLVAPHFKERQVVIGECKWTTRRVGKSEMDRFLNHTGPFTLAALPREGRGFTPHYVYFARSGFTRGALTELQKHGGVAIDLDALDDALRLP